MTMRGAVSRVIGARECTRSSAASSWTWRIRITGGHPLRAGHPLVRPLDDLEGEATLAKRSDHQPAACIGRIGLRMARRTERDELVEIKVRAALGALDDVVDLEGAPAATGLAPPAGTPEDHPADGRPFLTRRRRPAEGPRPPTQDPAVRRGADPHPRSTGSSQHRRPQPVCPRGQNLFLHIGLAIRACRLPIRELRGVGQLARPARRILPT